MQLGHQSPLPAALMGCRAVDPWHRSTCRWQPSSCPLCPQQQDWGRRQLRPPASKEPWAGPGCCTASLAGCTCVARDGGYGRLPESEDAATPVIAGRPTDTVPGVKGGRQTEVRTTDISTGSSLRQGIITQTRSLMKFLYPYVLHMYDSTYMSSWIKICRICPCPGCTL